MKRPVASILQLLLVICLAACASNASNRSLRIFESAQDQAYRAVQDNLYRDIFDIWEQAAKDIGKDDELYSSVLLRIGDAAVMNGDTPRALRAMDDCIAAKQTSKFIRSVCRTRKERFEAQQFPTPEQYEAHVRSQQQHMLDARRERGEDERRQFNSLAAISRSLGVAAPGMMPAPAVPPQPSVRATSSAGSRSAPAVPSAGSTVTAASGGVDTSQIGGSASGCPQTLGHLASRLPEYGDAELGGLRQKILNTSTVSAMRDLTAKGHTPRQAATLLMQQAEQYESAIPRVEQCIRSSTTNPEAVIQSVKAGSYDLQSSHTGISSSCIKAYVAAYYGVEANREMAVVASCMAR
jgi:hypothetical protein